MRVLQPSKREKRKQEEVQQAHRKILAYANLTSTFRRIAVRNSPMFPMNSLSIGGGKSTFE
jgi:hypothetical protein